MRWKGGGSGDWVFYGGCLCSQEVVVVVVTTGRIVV